MEVTLENDEQSIMEGWLYLIRSNKVGFQYLRKRYYVLQHGRFESFSSIIHSLNKDSVNSAVLNSCICVSDNGKKSIRGKVFYIFTVGGISSNGGRLKLGARNPEEAARWFEAFQKVSLTMNQHPEDILDCPNHEQQHSRLNSSTRILDTNNVDNNSLASFTHLKTGDMSSYWTIFRCHDGLRYYKEARNHEDQNKRNGHHAVAAMSVIDGEPDIVFQILMSLGSSRSEWDYCFQKGSMIENIDSHTDIIHKRLNDSCLPWGMKRRDLLLERYWHKDDDGTYIILYHSVQHKKCPPRNNYTRAYLKSGGYVISPLNKRKQSVVKHMLDIDWKNWRSYFQRYSNVDLSIHMIGRLAALREFFKTNVASYALEFSVQESQINELLPQSQTSMSVTDQINENAECKEDQESELSEVCSDRLRLVETDDEFFDSLETFLDDQSEVCSQINLLDTCHDEPCTPPANDLKKRFHEYTGSVLCDYKFGLLEDPAGNFPNSWSVPEPSLFQIRGETYLKDRKKITAESTLMQTIAVDWLKSDKREDNLAARPGNIVQKFAADGRPEFFFVINFQMPGSTTYNIASYYMTRTPINDIPLLEKFVHGDDAFRNSRFKLIPIITKGPWILKQTVNRPTLVGQLLKINYICGKNYIELDIDVGSSALARGLASTALSCFSSLIAGTAFLIQANTQDELPEQLIGASRLNHLDISKAIWDNP